MLSHRVDFPLPGMTAQTETFGYYGPDGQRWKTVLKRNGSVTKTVIFAGDYERVTRGDTITHLYYIAGGEGLCGIYVKQFKGNTVLKNGMYCIHADHLGSLAIITDAGGNVKQKCTFDAWGNHKFVVKDPALVFDRGYTGHEHLDEFGLINMNARLYDPVIGRFLSPDPFVQAPEFSQSFNRYSYCLNNPLIYTDPSGEIAWLIPAIKILASVYMAGVQSNFFHAAGNGGNPFNPGDWNWKSPWTYVSIASAGYGSFMDMGGIAAFKGAAASNPVTSNPEQVARWLEYTDDKNSLFAGPGTLQRWKGELWGRIPEVTIWGQQSDHARIMSAASYLGIYQAQADFWSHPVTRATTTVLTSMIGGGILSNYMHAYSAVNGYRYANVAAKGSNFAEKMFLSEKFGIISTRFGNSGITGVSGTWNQSGSFLKMGWSGINKFGGGQIFRIGIGSSGNKALFHLDLYKTFLPNSFVGPSMQLKQAIYSAGKYTFGYGIGL